MDGRQEAWEKTVNHGPRFISRKEPIMLRGITWFHHSSLLIQKGGKAVYIDPWELPDEAPKADVVLITHEHFDHYSIGDIKKISGPKTQTIAPNSMLGRVMQKVKYLKPGDKIAIDNFTIEAVAAYNEKQSFHPSSSQWLGYILEIDSMRYYHAGDTDFIPEMKGLKVDVAFLPVGGTYTMDAEVAVKAAEAIEARLVVPIHWGKVVGTEQDAVLFCQKYKGKSEILKPGKSY